MLLAEEGLGVVASDVVAAAFLLEESVDFRPERVERERRLGEGERVSLRLERKEEEVVLSRGAEVGAEEACAGSCLSVRLEMEPDEGRVEGLEVEERESMDGLEGPVLGLTFSAGSGNSILLSSVSASPSTLPSCGLGADETFALCCRLAAYALNAASSAIGGRMSKRRKVS